MFISLIVPIILLVIYSVIVHCFGKNQKWDWWHTFIATIVSVLFAIFIGMTLYNYQKHNDDRIRKSQYSKLIKAELTDIVDVLKSREKMALKLPFSEKEVLITYIQPLILEDAARSGLYNSVVTENMLHLARKIRMFNVKTSYFLSILASRNINEEQVLHGIKNIEETQSAIINDIGIIQDSLNADNT